MNEYKVGQLWIDPNGDGGRDRAALLLIENIDYSSDDRYVYLRENGTRGTFRRFSARDVELICVDNITNAMLQYPEAFRNATLGFKEICRQDGWEF